MYKLIRTIELLNEKSVVFGIDNSRSNLWILTMADKTILSDCLDKINSVVEAQKPLVYLSLKQKKSNHF